MDSFKFPGTLDVDRKDVKRKLKFSIWMNHALNLPVELLD